MVEFAVALGSKLDVINKHSFNNFRLRVGKGFLLLGQSGNFSSSQALPPPRPLLSAPQLNPGLPPDSSLEMEHEASGLGAVMLIHTLP